MVLLAVERRHRRGGWADVDRALRLHAPEPARSGVHPRSWARVFGNYLLTGQLVFEGSDGLQMLVKRLHDDPPPPSSRTELPLPAELERLVLACLARNPDGRPNAAELSRALAALHVEPWTEADASDWWRVNRP